ncbi:MAG: hypothetical protein AAGI91_17350 [Bacteroidota bacterium]
MSHHPNAPWGALPPGALAEAVAVLSTALSAAIADARRVRSHLRNVHVEPVHRVESADVEVTAIVVRLERASAELATVPGVWALIHGEDAPPPPKPRTDFAEFGRSLPSVLDIDAADRARQRAEAAGVETNRYRVPPPPPSAPDRSHLGADLPVDVGTDR